MIKKIIEYFFTPKKSEEQLYLESATDLCDLETRMKKVSFGNAPFQIRNRVKIHNYKGIYQ